MGQGRRKQGKITEDAGENVEAAVGRNQEVR
jgi:hypothetical protein